MTISETGIRNTYSSVEPAASETEQSRRSEAVAKFLAGVVGWIAIGGGIVLSSEGTRDFIFQWRWIFAIIGVVIAALAIAIVAWPAGRRWLIKSAPTKRAALFIFVGLPFVLVVVGFLAVLPSGYQLTALRVVFLVIVCLLPAIMWYLFVVTRKASVLNEFLSNLNRLGLLNPIGIEDINSKKCRVASYLQKFEALYGDLPPNIHDEVLQDRLRHYSRTETGAAASLSTATVPVMISTVLFAIGWLITLPPDPFPRNLEIAPWKALNPEATPVAFAFLGAYFFSLQLLFRRYVLKDLGGPAYVSASLRIVLALIGIWILAAANNNQFDETALLIIAFVVGVFPRVVWQLVQSLFKKAAGIAVPSMISQLPLSDLDGLTVWHEARLEEEDIENIPNMANADLVELLLNTRLPPEQIIDWTDQAILYTQLGPQGDKPDGARERLRVHGIRTATSLLHAAAKAKGNDERESFRNILLDHEKRSVLPTLEAALRCNSNLKLVEQWHLAAATLMQASVQRPVAAKATA